MIGVVMQQEKRSGGGGAKNFRFRFDRFNDGREYAQAHRDRKKRRNKDDAGVMLP